MIIGRDPLVHTHKVDVCYSDWDDYRVYIIV